MTKALTVKGLDTGLTGSLTCVIRDVNNDILFTGFAMETSNPGEYTVVVAEWQNNWSGTVNWLDNNVVVRSFPFQQTFPDYAMLEIGDNAYISIRAVQDYFSRRLATEAWDLATPENKLKSLCQATEAIDRLNFVGCKTDYNQSFQWPRNLGSTRTNYFPADIQKATAELALNLLDGIDPDLEDDLLSSQSDAYATVRVTSDPKLAKDHVKAGIVSIIAWRLLLPWLHDPRTITIRKG